jgi:hypothetical protein
MRRETGTLEAKCATNAYSDTITRNKTQIDTQGQQEQLNKEALKKPIKQQILLQSYTYTRKRSLSLGESTTK